MLLCCMKTFKDAFTAFHYQLNALYGRQEAEAIALMVLSDVGDVTRARIKAFLDDDMPPDLAEKLPVILTELQSGKPVQYVLGSASFYGLDFLVNPSVLIPRPETEELVDWILKSVTRPQQHILDIGTGSGCIAITLKKNLPDASVTAIDISEQALQTAHHNALMNDADVSFIQADALKLAETNREEKFSVIVSNPPYVTPLDKTRMHNNVVDFEPHTALFVPKEDPLLFYRAIADYASKALEPAGSLFFEINEAYGPETVAMMEGFGFSDIQLRQDLSGRDRMIKATLKQ